jgi:hypothetical protein
MAQAGPEMAVENALRFLTDHLDGAPAAGTTGAAGTAGPMVGEAAHRVDAHR